MNNLAIIAVAYSRPEALSRLLSSLAQAHYPHSSISLIISCDKYKDESVINEAKKFEWKYGEKTIIAHEKKLGLKNHILKCGDLVKDYDGIIMLEDDIFVSAAYYKYCLECVEKYGNDEKIAGISLYNHKKNVHCGLPFYALDDGYDNYFMQFSQSWGQCWTKMMWKEFREWLEKCDGNFKKDEIPPSVAGWPESSWLKYHIRYVIENDKYFVYPSKSLSTNFSDKGEHTRYDNSRYQVPITYNKEKFRLSNLKESNAIYDAYFNNVKIASILGFSPTDVVVDLYSDKPEGLKVKAKYLITCDDYDMKEIETFNLVLKPIEMNILAKVKGKAIKIYEKNNNLKKKSKSYFLENYYEYRKASIIEKARKAIFAIIKR